MRLKLLVLLSLLGCGCASVPVSYYTLIASPTTPIKARASSCCIVEIRSVRIPAAVDRQELIVRRSDAQLVVLSNDLWVAPLSEEVRGALLNDIKDKLPEARPGGEAAKFVLFVDVNRFEAEAAQQALIEAEWRIEPAGARKSAALVCKSVMQVGVAPGVSGLVRGYQQAISKLASSITLNVVAAEQGGAIECPSA